MAKGTQREFLEKVGRSMNFDWDKIAKLSNIHKRTLLDWRREKYQMSYEALKKLQEHSNSLLPKNIKVLPEYWSTRKAGKIGTARRYKLYGNPGTPEGRSKGGRTTQRRFNSDLAYARRKGFKTRKAIKHPEKTSLFAEFIGIVLGDGTIAEYQVEISLNSRSDREYACFVRKIIKELFGISASVTFKKKNTLSILISSKNLVEFLLNCGLKRGDKIRQQINVPDWILKEKELMRGCLRGLIDTDGCIYFHTHTTKGIKYKHVGLMLTNLSLPLLNSAHNIFLALGIAAKNNKKNHVSVYDRNEIIKYMNEVGSHNRKHIVRFKSYKGPKVFI